MKKQVFYIHGGEAYTNYEDFLSEIRNLNIKNPLEEAPKKWRSSLRLDLPEYEVFTPVMPNKQNAKYEEWKIWFEKHFKFVRDEIILIGGSLGGMFVVKYLLENELPFKIEKLLLVAAPFHSGRVNYSLEDGGDFAFDTSKVGDLAKKAEKIYIFHSKDDFVVPYEHALKYKVALPEAKLVTFEDKNHFLIPEFPELIENIRFV